MKILMRLGKLPTEAMSADKSIKLNTVANNSGNLLFQFSAYKMLCKDNEVTSYGYKSDVKDAHYINENFDIFVLPLANAFRKSFLKKLNEYTALIEKLKIPVMVLGVGAQADLNQSKNSKEVDDAVFRFCKSVLKRGPVIGVRGEYTKRYLQTIGIKNVDVIGCPSMFLYGADLPVINKFGLGKFSKIAINATENKTDFSHLFNSCVREYPKCCFIPQNITTLKSMVHEVVDYKKCDLGMSMPDSMEHPVFVYRQVKYFLDIPTWLTHIRAYDFAMGTRIHGNIISLLAGVPAHVIAHDSRTAELAEYFEIPHTHISDLNENSTIYELYDKSDFSGFNNNHKFRFEKFCDYLNKHAVKYDFSSDYTYKFFSKIKDINYPEPVEPVFLDDFNEQRNVANRLSELSGKISKVGQMLSRISSDG